MSGLRFAEDLPLPPGELGLEVCVTAATLEALRIRGGHHHANTLAGEALHLVAAQAPAGLFLGGGEEAHQRGNEHRSKVAPGIGLASCAAQMPGAKGVVASMVRRIPVIGPAFKAAARGVPVGCEGVAA